MPGRPGCPAADLLPGPQRGLRGQDRAGLEREARWRRWFVTRFEVESGFLSRYPIHQAGGQTILASSGFRPRSWTTSTPTLSARSRWSTSSVEAGRRATGQMSGAMIPAVLEGRTRRLGLELYIQSGGARCSPWSKTAATTGQAAHLGHLALRAQDKRDAQAAS